jgi:hypothetical protein
MIVMYTPRSALLTLATSFRSNSTYRNSFANQDGFTIYIRIRPIPSFSSTLQPHRPIHSHTSIAPLARLRN